MSLTLTMPFEIFETALTAWQMLLTGSTKTILISLWRRSKPCNPSLPLLAVSLAVFLFLRHPRLWHQRRRTLVAWIRVTYKTTFRARACHRAWALFRLNTCICKEGAASRPGRARCMQCRHVRQAARDIRRSVLCSPYPSVDPPWV